MNPASILAWLEANATQVLIQTVPAYRREKGERNSQLHHLNEGENE